MSVETLAEGKYLGLYKKGHWEFTQRPNSTACVGILPILPDGKVVLIEQFRVPMDSRVIEIPAGLVGDEEEFANESLSDTANRELIEETGYSGKITALLASPTSAGMTPEVTYLFAATELERISEGGGVAGEDIEIYEVALEELEVWLAKKVESGCYIDFKIQASLWLAKEKGLI